MASGHDESQPISSPGGGGGLLPGGVTIAEVTPEVSERLSASRHRSARRSFGEASKVVRGEHSARPLAFVGDGV